MRALSVLALAASGCAAADPASPTEAALLGEQRAALGSAFPPSGCVSSLAGAGWSNAFVPQSSGSLTVSFRLYPSGVDAAGHRLIDGVVGLSNGPAHGFTDLGPIVRFNSNGAIDARDGDRYVGGFPYVAYEPYEAKLLVDVVSHRYTVWVRHSDSINKPFELLGSDLAFRSEQQGSTRLDSAGVFVDSASGELRACGLRYEAPDQCLVSSRDSSSSAPWQSRAFPAQNRQFRLEFDALPLTRDGSSTLDAVAGIASGAPSAFTQLAAAIRFRPDGKVDARNGSSYSADVDFAYSSGSRYHVSMEIDAEAGRYSVAVQNSEGDPDGPPVLLAQDYGFRTEQAGTSSFDHLGQFIDAGEGELQVCSLTVVY